MKKHPRDPRRKRMTREGRLQSAKATRWLDHYQGQNIIKSYGKWFAVDPLCALIELPMLGVRIPEEREKQIEASINARAAERKRRVKSAAETAFKELYADSDDTFAYIVGYTSGGVPFGTTWEELEDDLPSP